MASIREMKLHPTSKMLGSKLNISLLQNHNYKINDNEVSHSCTYLDPKQLGRQDGEGVKAEDGSWREVAEHEGHMH